MVYAYDQNMQMPVKDLYDTQMMAMAINAAKDMYEKGQQRLDDFNKLYGSFITPIANDQAWYDKNVTGRLQSEINDMYANGIDPLRSAEGRSRIARLINSVPIGTINMMKANAELYEKRLAKEAQLGDKYNRSMDVILNGDPTQFSTVGDNGTLNSFNYAPPSAYQTIDELIEPVIKNIQPIYDYEYTKKINDGNDWYTVTVDRMMQAVNDNMSDILATPSGRFQYLLSQQEAKQLGKPELAEQIFKNKIANRLNDHVRLEPKVNAYKLADYKHNQAKQLAAMNNAAALARLRERQSYQASKSASGGDSKSGSDKEQYTDSEWQFKRLSTGILGKTSIGRWLGIGDASQFDYESMSGNTMHMAQQELIGKYYANDTSAVKGLVKTNGAKGVNFSDYQPTKVDLNKAIGTGKMSWSEVTDANHKFINSISADLSSRKFISGIGREIVNANGKKQYVYLQPEDIDRIYTEDYIALSASGMNRPQDLETAKKQNQNVRSALQNLMGNTSVLTAMRGAGKIVGLVSQQDGQWHTFAKIDISALNPDGSIANSNKTEFEKLKEKNNNVIYIDLGIDSYKNPNYGKDNNYDSNLTIDANGVHEDLRNVWDANVNKLLRVGVPNVGSTIAVPQMYDPEEFDWSEYEDYYDYGDYYN